MVWKILIVDDDPDVAEVVRMSLADFSYRGRRAEISLAQSAAEARGILSRRSDFAIVYMDVVMESRTAGLDLISEIRQAGLGWKTRYVLLTAHTVEAPEKDATRVYDLDGYIDKSDMTYNRLYAYTYSAVRSYDLLDRVDRSREAVLKAVQGLDELGVTNGVKRNVDAISTELKSASKDLSVKADWNWGNQEQPHQKG